MNDTPRFGTAGLADSYTVKKFDPAAIAAYTAGFGLTAFEYQCGRGVRLALDKAAALGAACAERDIALSVHAPYYISMSSLEEDKRLHSKLRPRQGAGRAARHLPFRLLRQAEPGGGAGKGAGYDGPRCQSLRRGRV